MRMIRQDLPTSVVIVGNPTRHVAQSAYTAGYRVGVIDTYKDRDLMELAEHHLGTGELAEDVKIPRISFVENNTSISRLRNFCIM